MDRLKALVIFKTIAETGGFTRAARALNMSCAQVTRSVGKLEGQLGVQLLQRTTRQVSLTSIGQEVLERARGLLDMDADLTSISHATVGEPTGTVRVLAPTYLRTLLAPLLAGYVDRYPKVLVDLRLCNAAPDLVAEEADFALCRQQDLRPSFVARPIASLEVAAFASADYLARCGHPQRPSELAQHECLGTGAITDGALWTFEKDKQSVRFQGKGAIGSNDCQLLVDLVQLGRGIAVFPVFMAQAGVSGRHLVRLFPGWRSPPVAIHLIYLTRRHQSMAVRRLIEHLAESFADQPDPRQGPPPATGGVRVSNTAPASLVKTSDPRRGTRGPHPIASIAAARHEQTEPMKETRHEFCPLQRVK